MVSTVVASLVQRVSGSYYGSYYMPCAAGVGYSYSPYKFLEQIDPKAGMLRLVMGLGTSAVDRTEGSYPRLVSLDMPQATSCTTIAEKHQFSQRNIEAVDTTGHSVRQMRLDQIEAFLPYYLENILLDHDFEVERSLRERGINRSVRFVSCSGIVKNQTLMEQIQAIMQLIQKEYEYPVDIEFTVNLSETGEYSINLLQCRPLQVFKDTGKVKIPEDIPEENIILENVHSSMGLSRNIKMDLIVLVDPIAYYHMPYAKKASVASLIGTVNWKNKGQNKHMLLMVPGRIGTSSPELGVPTTFADISEFEAICEIEEKKAGYNPELSYGSHIFQDLVEAEILYTAVFSNKKTVRFAPEKLTEYPDIVSQFTEDPELRQIVHVYDLSKEFCELCNDLQSERLRLYLR